MWGFRIAVAVALVVVATISALMIWLDIPSAIPLWARIVALLLLVVPCAAVYLIYNRYAKATSAREAEADAASEVRTNTADSAGTGSTPNNSVIQPLDCTKPCDREIALTYYDYFREEIRREDEITHQRITWTMTFQGFIITATTLLIVAEFTTSKQLIPIARLPAFAFAFIGLCTGLVSLMGILASRHSIKDAVEEWKARDAVWGLREKYVPQAYGTDRAFDGGDKFATLMPVIFVGMWAVFLWGYFLYSYPTWIEACSGSDDFLRCMFTRPPARIRLFGYEFASPWEF